MTAGCLTLVRDISERKRAQREQERLQAQLIQAQKMESTHSTILNGALLLPI